MWLTFGIPVASFPPRAARVRASCRLAVSTSVVSCRLALGRAAALITMVRAIHDSFHVVLVSLLLQRRWVVVSCTQGKRSFSSLPTLVLVSVIGACSDLTEASVSAVCASICMNAGNSSPLFLVMARRALRCITSEATGHRRPTGLWPMKGLAVRVLSLSIPSMSEEVRDHHTVACSCNVHRRASPVRRSKLGAQREGFRVRVQYSHFACVIQRHCQRSTVSGLESVGDSKHLPLKTPAASADDLSRLSLFPQLAWAPQVRAALLSGTRDCRCCSVDVLHGWFHHGLPHGLRGENLSLRHQKDIYHIILGDWRLRFPFNATDGPLVLE